RRRIRTEAEDQLRSDDDALSRFGSPAEVALRFREELAAPLAHRAAFRAFGALAAAGVAYAFGFLTFPMRDVFAGRQEALGVIALLAVVLAPQGSFVGGMLALVRGVRSPQGGRLVAGPSGLRPPRGVWGVGA